MSTKFGVNATVQQPKSVILSWLNNLLTIDLTKIEELGSGSIYCQLLDVIFPGKVPLKRIKWKAKTECDFIYNFKILQNSFDSLRINKAIPLQKLAQAKYQDNLEFIQWFKKFFDVNCKEKGKDYNALERRGNAQPEFSWIKRGAPPKFTLHYSHNQKATNQIQSFSNQNAKSDTQSQTQSHELMDQNDHEQVTEPIQKKIKINPTATPMRTFFRQSSMPETRSTVTPNSFTFKNSQVPDNFECKYFLKKTTIDQDNKNYENKENISSISQQEKPSQNLIQSMPAMNHKLPEKIQISDKKIEKALIHDAKENESGKKEVICKLKLFESSDIHTTLFNQENLLQGIGTPDKTEIQAEKTLNNILEIIQNGNDISAQFKIKKIKQLLD